MSRAVEFHPKLTESEKQELLAEAGALCGVGWWKLWCAARYGEGPLPNHYAHVASLCGWPVDGMEGDACDV